jgi:hypothetical protein
MRVRCFRSSRRVQLYSANPLPHDQGYGFRRAVISLANIMARLAREARTKGVVCGASGQDGDQGVAACGREAAINDGYGEQRKTGCGVGGGGSVLGGQCACEWAGSGSWA